ncbi:MULTISPECIES: Gfo/Idh/MocA family protein [unclassified Listeria]|uniref:Gfo/Idh/MocA family protein n=1 Tax=unclassified Listeria TaxID=2642072 RepID=UPI000B5932E1|nr:MULTISPECIES: Gfo/Idh/MocA family oxidoreductase [unclassified Listeria]
MKVAIIGLGGIAQKAYLPVFAEMENVEIHLYTRNSLKLKQLSDKYRFPHIHQSIDSLIEAGIEAAFVHSSTASHPEIVRQLLDNQISVYVDKPISDNIEETRALTALAKEKKTLFMTGFNRRFVPFYQTLKELPDANMIVIQKNRPNQPGEARTFIYDDFIHVIDSVRFLLGEKIQDFDVYGTFDGDLLASVTVQFKGETKNATAIMNRNSGVSEEKAELMTKNGKWTVANLTELTIQTGIETRLVRHADWEGTLAKRGFVPIIHAFLDAVRSGAAEPISKDDALETHEICEAILKKLSER